MKRLQTFNVYEILRYAQNDTPKNDTLQNDTLFYNHDILAFAKNCGKWKLGFGFVIGAKLP